MKKPYSEIRVPHSQILNSISLFLIPPSEIRNPILILSFLFILAACGGKEPAAPIIASQPGAPVTVTLSGDELIVANNTAGPIYQRLFPSEVLAFIEWAPCWQPEQCPDEEPIAAGEARTTSLKSIVERDTEAITLFWWPMPGPQAGFDIRQIEIELP